ncbi:low temperature requirement protein A [Streptomyces sp. NPDC058268]|uniref:low temperature requirement protein A n=1 Tax=Streptomyces sp. NPDC058268 TaxID=3346413 RepID=UPI0036E3FDC3
MITRRDGHGMVATGESHRVTPAELFFDLAFVYAITQVTALMAADPTVTRLLGAGVVLALLWFCWCCFAWLGNVVRADAGALFGVLVVVMAGVFVVSLTVPEVYTDAQGGVNAPLVFVLCYGAFRALHLIAYWISHPNDARLRATLRKTALTSVLPPFLILLAGSFFTGPTQILIWLCAVLVDYAAIYVLRASGWRVASPGHFAERHGLIVIIALGESIVAVGVGARGYPLTYPVLVAAVGALLIAAMLWRLYFRQLSDAAEERILAVDGDVRTRLAGEVYTFLHLPLVGGIVLTALGVESLVHQVADTKHYDLSEPLHGLAAWALPGGVGLFLLAVSAIRWRIGRLSAVLLAGGALCSVAGVGVVHIPGLLALAMVAVLLLVAVALHHREVRTRTVAERGQPGGAGHSGGAKHGAQEESAIVPVPKT